MDLEHKIIYCLKFFPYTRNSDMDLTVEIWKNFEESNLKIIDGDYYLKLSNLKEVSREDNIKRIRAKIQNEERLFLPTDISILIERARLSKAWRELLGYAPTWTEADFKRHIENFLDRPRQETLI